jgi:hypothetical protein
LLARLTRWAPLTVSSTFTRLEVFEGRYWIEKQGRGMTDRNKERGRGEGEKDKKESREI